MKRVGLHSHVTKFDQAIEALSTLPEAQREELAEVVLELAAAMTRTTDVELTPEQWAEVERRLERGFRLAEPGRLDEILARYE
jgi:thymidine phosphorylase